MLEDLGSSMAFSIRGRLLRLVSAQLHFIFTLCSYSFISALLTISQCSGDLVCEATAQRHHQRLEGEHLPGVEWRGSCRHWRNEMFSWDEAQKGRKEGKIYTKSKFFTLSRLSPIYPGFYPTGILQ